MEPSSSTPSPTGLADSTFASVKQEPNSNPSSPVEASSPDSGIFRNKGYKIAASLVVILLFIPLLFSIMLLVAVVKRKTAVIKIWVLGNYLVAAVLALGELGIGIFGGISEDGTVAKSLDETTIAIGAAKQHYVAADSNSSSTTKSFVPCKVCGDKASGYHYGVTSCEGCKGFFRRSIQKQIEYRCLRDGKCLVIRLNRNRCQYCRFKKCLAVGMSRDSVRYGRVPKRSRERSTEETSRVSTTDADQSDSETKQLAVYDVILTVSQAHHANCGYTEEHTRNLVRKPLVMPSVESSTDNEVASSTAESLEQQRCWLWQQFAGNITPSVQRVVEFAKRVPGFCDLGQDDQLILIKIGFFEIWLSHIARMTSNSSLIFDDGVTVSRQQLEVMYDTDFISSVLHFANTFNALALNDTELGLFSAVILLTADRPGITDVKSIEHHQDKLIEALKVQVGRNHANEPQLFSSLLIKLPELRNLGAKHTAHLDWFRVNWAKLTLPPLFAEIFDIPKSEDDV